MFFFWGGRWQDTQTVVYTTGSYVIREVCCEFCDNKLGTDRMKHHEKTMKTGKWSRESNG